MLFNDFYQSKKFKSSYIILDFVRFTLFTVFVYCFYDYEIILFSLLIFITIIFNIYTMISKPFNKLFVLMETLFIEVIATLSLLAALFYSIVEKNTSDGTTRLLFGLFIQFLNAFIIVLLIAFCLKQIVTEI